MTQEIIYTSAPSGLKPGSRGFCTVVATRGIAKPLADQLEDLSGYRHLAPSGDASASQNPIVFSHLKLNVAGRSYHVLSRICDAGNDYTNRTNKLAHHIALEPQELVPGGPAALLQAPGFMALAWSGAPAVRDAGPVPPRVDVAPAVCRTWAQLSGDAGWGGAVAEVLAGDSRRQIVLIYRPGTDVLSLAMETLALLPMQKRWEATFCTYFTKLPPTVDCRWRFVVDGTPEADTAPRAAGALVIDLRKPLPPPPESAFTQAARSGTAVPIATSPTLRSQLLAATDADDLLLAELEREVPQGRAVRSRLNSPASPTASTYGVTPPPIQSAAAGFDDEIRNIPMGRQKRPRKERHPAFWMAIGSGLFVLVSAVGAAGFYAWKSTGSKTDLVSVPSSSDKNNSIIDRTAPASTAPASTAPASTAPASTAPASTAPASTAPASTAPASTAPASTAPASTAPASTAPRSMNTELASESMATTSNPNSTNAYAIDLPDASNRVATKWKDGQCDLVSVAPAETYDLSVVFASNQLEDGCILRTALDRTNPNLIRVQQFRSQPKQEQTIATFSIEDGSLKYRPWSGLGSLKKYLSSAVIKITPNGTKTSPVIVTLRTPQKYRTVSLNTLLSAQPTRIEKELELPIGVVLDAENLLLSTKSGQYPGVRHDNFFRLAVPVHHDAKLEIDITFQHHPENNAITLHARLAPGQFKDLTRYALVPRDSLSSFAELLKSAESKLKGVERDLMDTAKKEEWKDLKSSEAVISAHVATLKRLKDIALELTSATSLLGFRIVLEIGDERALLLEAKNEPE